MNEPAPPPSELPALPGRFEVLEALEAPGGVRLLRARDTLLGREVFLKAVAEGHGGEVADPRAHERILREARALAQIDHPAVHHLLDVLETPEGMLLVLEPLAGETLTTRLGREGRLPAAEVVQLGIRLAGALEAVHRAGLVHRGIDTDAILLDERAQVTLTGFHFAKATGPAGGAASSLAVNPSGPGPEGPAHPAPEQLTKGQDDPRADLFGLGWVLYECLTGVTPYRGTNPLAWTPPEDACTLAPEAPRGLGRTLALCLSLSPAGRPADAGELRAALEGLAPATPAPAAAAGAPRAVASTGRPWTWPALAGFAGAALLYLALGGPLPRSQAASTTRGLVPEDEGGADATASGPVRYAPRYARSHALLIGIGDAYRGSGFPALENAERDVVAVARALEREGTSPWHIQKLLGGEATREAVIDALGRLSDRTGPDDRVLLFFAGHGKAHDRAEGSGWIIPAGATPGPDGRAGWIRFDELFRFFQESRAKHILVAMDCCYGGRLLTARAADAQAYSERFLTRPAHVVMASGRGDEQVSDGAPGGHSPFARALVDALAGRGPLTSTMLYASIQEAILGTGVHQTPEFGYPDPASVGGEVVFFRGE